MNNFVYGNFVFKFPQSFLLYKLLVFLLLLLLLLVLLLLLLAFYQTMKALFDRKEAGS